MTTVMKAHALTASFFTEAIRHRERGCLHDKDHFTDTHLCRHHDLLFTSHRHPRSRRYKIVDHPNSPSPSPSPSSNSTHFKHSTNRTTSPFPSSSSTFLSNPPFLLPSATSHSFFLYFICPNHPNGLYSYQEQDSPPWCRRHDLCSESEDR